MTTFRIVECERCGRRVKLEESEGWIMVDVDARGSGGSVHHDDYCSIYCARIGVSALFDEWQSE